MEPRETPDEALKNQILYKYCIISEDVSKLYESIRFNRLNEVRERDMKIRPILINLIYIASLNRGFESSTREIAKKYKAGLPLRKQTHKSKHVCMARDTVLVWEKVSKALVDSKLLSLGD